VYFVRGNDFAESGNPAVTGTAESPGQSGSTARLWAQAAHDLGQPVQAVLLLTRMLPRASGRADLKRTVEHIEAALESLHGMLEVMALLARIEGGLQSVQLRSCQLAEVLEPVIADVTRITADQGMRLRCRRMQGTVRSHPKLLAIATRSLLLNAVRHAEGGDILASSHRRGGQLRLEVQFKGARLDAAGKRNAFVQLPPRSDGPVAGELGLGLALLEHLCRRLGLDLQLTETSPNGQVLALVLPLVSVSR
jgi:two-component system, sensor histidine kinase